MKKMVAMLLALSMLFTLMVGCSSGDSGSSGGSTSSGTTTTPDAGTSGGDSAPADDGKVYTMRLGAISSEPAPEAWFIKELEPIIEEATNGRIDVEVYPSGQIGTTQQMIQGLQDGSNEGVLVPCNYYESYVPELGILGLPMFFESPEQAFRCCSEGEFNDILDQCLEAKGFVVGTWGLSATSTILSNKEIKTIDDLKGLNIWTLPNSRITAVWNNFGATPVNFDTGDLAVGMQQGTVDAAYTGSQLFNSLRLQESSDYYIYPTQAINFNVQVVMLSKAWCDTLPADLYETLIATLEEHGQTTYFDYAVDFIAKSEEAIKGTEGVETWYTDEAFNAAAAELAAPIREQFYADANDTIKHLWDLAMAYMEANPVN